jgi:hypothetical protein
LRDRISSDVRAIAADPAVLQRLRGLGMVGRGSTPAEYTAVLAEQRSRWMELARIYRSRPQP